MKIKTSIIILYVILSRHYKKGDIMKRFLLTVAIAIASLTTVTSAADVGVSISVGQPGFYGQLNIGDYPQPRVIYAQPMIIEHRTMRSREPIYLRVPYKQTKHWNKYCRRYNACNRPVLFVHDDWYEREYVPRYQERHHDHGNDYRDDRRDDRQDDDHGNQKNKDKGHGNDR